MTETAILTFRDETKQVPFTLATGENAEAQVKAKAGKFLALVEIDDILRYLAQEIIDDAYL